MYDLEQPNVNDCYFAFVLVSNMLCHGTDVTTSLAENTKIK
jgi:hypothetical protein